ncbi:MAG TPA: hypothetical protein PLU30_24740 [Verrucomicrobiae bacterium]|nr:hypothetical protein [Verrucomicrobiae bacterium]
MKPVGKRPVLAALLAVVLCGPVVAAEPVAAIRTTTADQCRVQFDSFVGIHYTKLPALRGWASTAEVIRKTLSEWFPRYVQGQVIVDGSPDDLIAFLRRLPGPDAADFSVVYLASQQAADGSWAFVNGQSVSWVDIVERSRPVPPHPRRIVIVDACYAATLERVPGWRTLFPGPVLFAASPRERTFEFRLDTRLPLDFKKRAPEAWEWSRRALPRWDGRMSFLGLVWMQASQSQKSGPLELGGWEELFGDCCRQGADFQKIIRRQWGSTLSSLKASHGPEQKSQARPEIPAVTPAVIP